MIEPFVQTDFKAVDKRDELATIFGYLRGDQGDVPLVLDDGRPYGVLNERALMRSRLDPHAHIDSYVVGTRTLPPEASVDEALDVVATSHIAIVPVTRKRELLGYVRALDLLDALDTRGAGGATAAELSREVPILTTEASVGEALHEMQKTGAPALPVVGKDGRLAGLVRRRDVLQFSMDNRAAGRKPPAPQVDPRADEVVGFVDKDVETVREDAGFDAVRDALKRGGVAVVLARDGSPRGLLAPEGVAAAVAERRRTIRR